MTKLADVDGYVKRSRSLSRAAWEAGLGYGGLGPDATATGRTKDDDIQFTVDLLGFKRGGP